MLSEEAKRRSQAEGGPNMFSEGKNWRHLEQNTGEGEAPREGVGQRLSREALLLAEVA